MHPLSSRLPWSLGLLLALAGAALAAPEDRGPVPFTVHDAGTLSLGGAEIPTKVYLPDAPAAPGPTAVIMHGNLRTGSYHTELASTLASRGFVVVLPDMPCGLGGCDHEANAAQLSALLEWASAQNQDEASPLYGKSSGRRGLFGHSYGGLGVFLATARDPSVEMVVLFDPKDNLGVGAAERQNLRVPSAHLMAEVRGVCNDDWANAVYPGTTPPRLRLRVSGSGHCDVEQPGDSLCPLACGRGSGGSALFRRYAVAFASCVLQGDPEMEPYVGGAALASDHAAGSVDLVDHAGLEALPCRSAAGDPPLFDAGAAPLDASVGDDAAPSEPFRPTRPDAGSAQDSSDGCRCLAASPQAGALFLLLLGLPAFTWRAVRRRLSRPAP